MGSAQQAASHVAAEVGAASPTASVYSVLHGTRTHQQRDEQTRCNDRTTAWGTGRTGPLTSGRAAWRRCSLRTRRAPSTAPDRAGPAQPCAGAGVSEPASGEKSQQRDGAPSSAPAGGTAAVCLLCWVRGRSARACVVRQRPRGPAQLSGYVCISPAGCGEIQGSPIRSLMHSCFRMARWSRYRYYSTYSYHASVSCVVLPISWYLKGPCNKGMPGAGRTKQHADCCKSCP